MSPIDWKGFEGEVRDAARTAIIRLMDRHAGLFYAVVFHEFYAEMGGAIAMPCLAANTEEALTEDEDARWSSADWKWTEIRYANAATRKLHRTIASEAASRDDSDWQKSYARFIDAFIAVAKKLTTELKQHPRATKDFAVLVFTEDDEVEVLRRCLTPSRFHRLFPQLQSELDEAQQRDALPLDGKLAIYRSDIRQYEAEVLQLGAKALPLLRDALADEEQAWVAADCLARIGVPDPDVIRVLKEHARLGDEIAFHETTALALLGEVDFLLELADSARTRDIAIRGICGLYSNWLNDCQVRRPLDYTPLERLLENPSCKRKVKELYGGSCEITESDVDEALRGLESPHAVIREHAVRVLGDRRLGTRLAPRILTSLAARLRDRSATVRRLALLSLGYWKKAARPYVGEIRRLIDDPNVQVAQTAEYALNQVG